MDSVLIEQTLAGCEIFKLLKPDEIKIIAGICRTMTFSAGEFVYQQGDFGEYLYVIAEGRVVLEKSMPIGSREGKVVIATLGRGRVFGCWSTLLGEPHILVLTTYCQNPTTLLAIKGRDLRNLMMQDAHFGFNVMERLCFLLRERIQSAYGAMDRI